MILRRFWYTLFVTPEQEKELLELTRENNEILKKVRKSMFWSRIIRIAYFLIIIGITLGAYYFVQPYLESVLGAYSNLLGQVDKIQQTGTSLPDVSRFFDFVGN